MTRGVSERRYLKVGFPPTRSCSYFSFITSLIDYKTRKLREKRKLRQKGKQFAGKEQAKIKAAHRAALAPTGRG